jgi:phosphorylase kinase alpha/beta subunit
VTLIYNPALNAVIRPGYSVEEVRAVASLLESNDTLRFVPLSNGLFPAAALDSNRSYTGYSYVWVRDNIHIAHAHYRTGQITVATNILATLMKYFIKHERRFLDIIENPSRADVPMNRPHIRFKGDSLEEIAEKWAHAQNDALGYFLWMFSKLVNENALAPGADQLSMLALFPAYFDAIRYWQDEDSGHWEEVRKVSASSIGAVVAGLGELAKLLPRTGSLHHPHGIVVAADMIARLIERGRGALQSILPAECIEPDPAKKRPYDAALLFLIYPLQVVEGNMADRILSDVIAHLQGEVGIRRYLGDSYWAPDYKRKVKPAQRTADVSDDLSSRDQLLTGAGQEAQWCIFDPILSCIFGMKLKSERSPEHLARQTEYLNRSLGQITGGEQTDVPAFRCPELYYFEAERLVPNDHVPLLWTQANLMLALQFMQESYGLLQRHLQLWRL